MCIRDSCKAARGERRTGKSMRGTIPAMPPATVEKEDHCITFSAARPVDIQLVARVRAKGDAALHDNVAVGHKGAQNRLRIITGEILARHRCAQPDGRGNGSTQQYSCLLYTS